MSNKKSPPSREDERASLGRNALAGLGRRRQPANFKGRTMAMHAISERWQQVAIEIGHAVRSTVNTPAMIGSDDETGYILMFFNTKHHHGKSTLVSSTTDRAELKKLLKYALRNIDGPKSAIVEPGSAH